MNAKDLIIRQMNTLRRTYGYIHGEGELIGIGKILGKLGFALTDEKGYYDAVEVIPDNADNTGNTPDTTTES